jgi:xanthine dehydrogenase molybdopterin-binding subunit B
VESINTATVGRKRVEITHDDIKKSIIKSQHCQRNYDLSKAIPQDDLDVLIYAATNCPSKQNIAYYKVHVITNQEVISNIHNMTNGFTVNYETNERLRRQHAVNTQG